MRCVRRLPVEKSNKRALFSQNLTPEQAEYCIKRMKQYIDPISGRSIPGALDYEEFVHQFFNA